MSHPSPTWSAANNEARSRRAVRHLSLPLVIFAAAAFAAGVAAGHMSYLHPSPMLHKHILEAAAWLQQLAVAALAAAVLGYAYWRHRRSPGRPGGAPALLSPPGRPAAGRLARTVRTGLGGPSAPARAALALPLAGLLLYWLYRAGEQVTARLDPSFTVNAWGGPTNLGALAAHYLDGLVLIGEVWLLHLILPPDPANLATGSAARSRVPPAADGRLPRAAGAEVRRAGHRSVTGKRPPERTARQAPATGIGHVKKETVMVSNTVRRPA
jgi:hypothetical protein